MPNNAYKRYRKINYKILESENVTKIMSEQTDKKNVLKCNEDTIIRTEIHGIIMLRLKEGKNQEEIINELSENKRYIKYSNYFENWIIDKQKKAKNKQEMQK